MIRAYDFVCGKCGNPFEIWGTPEEHSKGLIKNCPVCGSEKIEEKPSVQVSTGKKTRSGGSSGCGPASRGGCCG
jgi:putative FmdB family regulatory protein